MGKANRSENDTDPVVAELAAIKQLLILALIREGVQQSQIASALGVSDATISRTFPKGLLKTIRSTNAEAK